MTSPSSTRRPTRTSPIFSGPIGREPDDVAVLLDDAEGRPAQREARLLGHVARLAMDRHDDLRPDPVVHRRQLGPAGMAGDVDVRLAVGDDR